ncbi:MAG: bifunctional riboflavin kinase/FAD synthetase [Pseudomonadota bacterium]
MLRLTPDRLTLVAPALPDTARGGSIAIGNFDGVHLGHQAVIEHARKPGLPLGVMTFEPHPRAWFAAQRGVDLAPFRLMTSDTRALRLEKLGVDLLYELPFGPDLAALSPEEFVTAILIERLGAHHVAVGQDFFFGRDRAGTADTLVEIGAKHGLMVTVADMVHTGPTEVSSTNIRLALTEGRPGDAAQMLGHWHRITGPVVHGEKRGRELGYPTANMSLHNLHAPAYGVYAVTVDVLDGPHRGTYGGAASIGTRPMFGDNEHNCETFLFDFTGDLYGATLSVGLVAFLRGEENFDSLDELIAQMEKDCAQARTILADTP